MNLDNLKENKEKLIAEKHETFKRSEAFGCAIISAKMAEKSETSEGKDVITVKAVINTTGIIDSHMDLHVKGIWDDHLKTNPRVVHLQEHESKFDKIIADGEDVKASAEIFSWKDLGVQYSGETQALVFESKVRKERNPYMYEQYSKGFVKNHSVGMRYGEILLAVNSEDKYWAEEKANWDEYIGQAVNPEVAEKQGMFWVVKSATFHEGSAVVFGSNSVTPTLQILGKDLSAALNSKSNSVTPTLDIIGKDLRDQENRKKRFRYLKLNSNK